MRSTVAIALALATVAVPAFSAPLPESSYTYDLVARTPLTERDLVELLGRAQAADGESGALGFGTLFKLGKGLVSSAEHILGGNNNNRKHRRDYDELQQRDELISMLLSRSAEQGDDSGALGLGTIFKVGKGIVSGAEHIFGGNNNNNQQHRREFYDFEARDDLEARDFDYLEARDDLEARDFDYLEARDELEARDDLALEPLARQDQSGAFNFGKFLKGAVGVVSHLLRREELEMLAREEPEYFARSLYELD